MPDSTSLSATSSAPASASLSESPDTEALTSSLRVSELGAESTGASLTGLIMSVNVSGASVWVMVRRLSGGGPMVASLRVKTKLSEVVSLPSCM